MKRIAILGSGLLGGSIALAVQSRLSSVEVSLWGRSQKSVQEAGAQGIRKATTNLLDAVSGADLIILAIPVGAMLEVLDRVTQICNLEGVIVTDVGSVKLTPREDLKVTIKEAGALYIGSHPMAGSEQAGVSAAKEDLFDGAACVLTNDFKHPESDVEKLTDFWESIGCQCYLTTAEEHDRVMARISHMPHLLASIGALVGLKYPEDGKFAGNGMRDTTRIASGHPAMWAEILLSNREALKKPIEEAIDHLREMLALLGDSSEESVTEFLAKAKQLRDTL